MYGSKFNLKYKDGGSTALCITALWLWAILPRTPPCGEPFATLHQVKGLNFWRAPRGDCSASFHEFNYFHDFDSYFADLTMAYYAGATKNPFFSQMGGEISFPIYATNSTTPVHHCLVAPTP